MVKAVAAISSWENVNRAKASFKTNDKILTRILKFVPNVFKLIAAFFIDCYNRFFSGFENKSKIKGLDLQPKAKKTNNLKNKRRLKLFLGLIFGAGLVGLSGYFIHSNDVVSTLRNCFSENKIVCPEIEETKTTLPEDLVPTSESCSYKCIQKARDYLNDVSSNANPKVSEFHSKQCEKTTTAQEGTSNLTIQDSCVTSASNRNGKRAYIIKGLRLTTTDYPDRQDSQRVANLHIESNDLENWNDRLQTFEIPESE